MLKVKLVSFLCLISLSLLLKAQLLYPETYVIILDTARHFKGIVAPSIEVKTPKELYIEINNTTNLAYRLKDHSIILANKFELTRNGSETILSGGFVYAKLKTFYDNPFVLEKYAQYQWAEARGLARKYAVGTNLRYKLYKNATGGAFIGLGPFYEHEDWNYQGVPDSRLPDTVTPIQTDLWKLNFYLSLITAISEKIKFEGAFYYQDPFDALLTNPRLGGSTGFSYQISQHMAFAIQLRTLYDFKPIVPVDKLWFNAFTELQVTF